MNTKYTITLIAAVFAVAVTTSAVSLTANSQQTTQPTTQTAQTTQSLDDYNRQELTTILQYLTNIANQLQVALQVREQTGTVPTNILTRVGEATRRVAASFGLSNMGPNNNAGSQANQQPLGLANDTPGPGSPGGGSSGGGTSNGNAGGSSGGSDNASDNGSSGGSSSPANEAPQASFTTSRDTLTVDFSNQSSDPDGSITSYSWDFGDSNTNSNANPSHTYATSGTYTVQLTVTDDDGDTDTTSKDISVAEADIIVDTLDDALALSGVEVGTTIKLRGRNEVNDGGGGLFEVTNSACETDGGTCFVFDEDVSGQKSYTSHPRGDGLGSDDYVGNTDLVWGTVSVQYGDTREDSIGTEFLHGHSKANAEVSAFDYKEGLPTGTTNFWGLRQWYNDDPDGPYTVRYKHATADKRLERKNVSNAVSIDWWGAKRADPNNPVNNWWRINWAINAAAEIYKNNNVEWAYVDIPGEYYYRYAVRIREGVKLRGTSDQTFADAANGRPTHGKLTIMPGMAMNHTKDEWTDTHVHHPLRVAAIDLQHDYMTAKFGMESLEVDGNIDENLEPIKNTDGTYNNVQSKLQNGNNWNGFVSKANDAWAFPESGGVADFDDVYIHDFPGNGISGWRGQLRFDPSSNVRVGSAPRNHQLYRASGLHDGLTVEGAGWASLIKQNEATFKDLTVKPNPNELNQYWGTSWFKVFDHHGKGFGADWFAEKDFREDIKIDVDKFTVDLTDEPRSHVSVFADKGYGGSYASGTILSTPTKGTTLVSPVSSGNGPIKDYTYKSIEVTDQGGGVSVLGGGTHTHLTIKDLSIKPAKDVGPNGRGLIAPSISDPDAYAEYGAGDIVARLPMAARSDISNLDAGVPQNHTIIDARKSGGMPYDLFIQNSSIKNTANDKAQALLYGSEPQPQFRVYLDETTFNVYEPLPTFRTEGVHYHVNQENPPLRLRNSQDRNGRTSDQTGTYTSTSTDEGNDYVLIPTDLMSLAQEKTATVTSGNRTVTNIENADANGNIQTFDPNNPQAFDPRDPYLKVNLDAPIQSGNTITLDWTARVTPLEDYRTTGLFTARPISDKTYTAGNGPWTIDLRGVAASQESKEPIIYSATAEDNSVVTASMNSYTDPNNNDIPWELELTEQSTGTTTINITGSINGVGTATTSFQVGIQ